MLHLADPREAIVGDFGQIGLDSSQQRQAPAVFIGVAQDGARAETLWSIFHSHREFF